MREPDPKPGPGPGNGLAQALSFAAQLGFAIACPMLAFIGGGAWLDSKAHTSPLLLFAGIILGLLAAAGTIYQLLKWQSGRNAAGGRPSAPYKLEQDQHDPGTKSADKRGRERSNGR